MKSKNISRPVTRRKLVLVYLLEVICGIILITVVAACAIRTDLLKSQKNMTDTAAYINEQCNSFKRLNLASESKSLMRMVVSSRQIRNNISYEKQQGKDDSYIYGETFLKNNVQECYLTGVIILDRQGELKNQYYEDETGAEQLKEYLDRSSLIDVCDKEKKMYCARINCNDGSYIDLAACGLEDKSGVVATYYHTSAEYVDDYNLSFKHILAGYYAREQGTVVVTSGERIIASSNESMIGDDVDNYNILKKIKDSSSSGILKQAKPDDGSRTHNFGLMKKGRNYYVYIYLPEKYIFEQTASHILYTFAVYMVIVIIFNMVRWKTARGYEAEQNVLQKQYAAELAWKNEQLKEAVIREEKANAAKSGFLSRMTHDIRTPLNGIIGLLKIDEKHMNDIELINANRQKMMVAANHLLLLINDILQMSKLETDNIELSYEVIDLNQLAKDVITIIEQRAADGGVNIEYEKSSGDVLYPYVYGSPLHLRQIFLNIYGNCVKYNRVGGYVRTEFSCVEKTNDYVRYKWVISDNGVGMNEEFVKHIFEPFAQEKSDARSEYQGTGLGMAIVKRLVDKMNGTIEVTSVKDKGSSFTIIIPFRMAAAPVSTASDKKADNIEKTENVENVKPVDYMPDEKSINTDTVSADIIAEDNIIDISGFNILLAEDNKLNAEIVETFLGDEGAVVTTVNDGQQAVEAFAAHKPGTYDIILMDVMMPKLDGITAAKLIRKLDRPDAAIIPIIAMTANAFEEDAKKCIEAGMNVHMAKPLDMDEVIEVIARLCDGVR